MILRLAGDGDLDLALGNSRAANQLFRNDGAGVFTPVDNEISRGVHDTSCLSFGDYNGDGRPDLLEGNMGEVNRLLRNDGHTFTSVTSTPVTDGSDYTYALEWGDWNNDGYLE